MIIVIALLFGLAIASFLNAGIFRLDSGRSIIHGRSRCYYCKTELAWYDLVPIASFAVLRGRCRTCAGPIDIQYPLVEFAGALLFVLALFLVPAGVSLGVGLAYVGLWWFIFSVFIFLFVYDARFGELPDKITLPSIAIVFIWTQFLGWDWKSSLIGLAVGALFFLIQHALSRGRWVGNGDIRLGALLGLIVGWPLILTNLFFAYVIGLLVAVVLMVMGKKGLKDTLPFGTFLIIGALITIFFSPGLLPFMRNLL